MLAVDDVGDMRENISGSSISGVGQFGVPNLISSCVIFRSKKKFYHLMIYYNEL